MTRGPLLRPEPAGAEFLTYLHPPDWSAVFGRTLEGLELEIGSGAGGFALAYAGAHPGVGYVAIEWRKKYAREVEHRARQGGLHNLRVVEADARRWCQDSLARAVSTPSTSSSPTRGGSGPTASGAS